MTSRPQRKRKKPEFLSEVHPNEERDLAKALYISLRPLPSGDISEDEIQEEEEPQEPQEEDTEEEGDVQGEKDRYEVKWGSAPESVTVFPFHQPFGMTKSLPSSKTVKHFFELMFSYKVWHHICHHTNDYAKQMSSIHPDPDWKPVTIAELKAWVGCLIAMGLNKLPQIKMYWETPWQLSLVTNRFTRLRFLSIRKYLHLADNSTLVPSDQKGYDPLGKIRPLINLLTSNFQANYSPQCYLTADEDICKFKGRNKMKQYLRGKIIKWGYKIWKLCDATTAYVLNLSVFTGKTTEKSAPYGVVMSLMEQYLDKNHVVVMDNYFTGVPLFLDLLRRSTYACGTVRRNRKYLPEQFKEEENKEPGEYKFWQSSNLVATIWQDKRPVRFLSTCCDPVVESKVTRKRKQLETASLTCPLVVKIYSENMGGVDRSDRLVRTYSVSRQSHKWWFRLFYYLLDTALANSYILYNQSSNHSKISEIDYLKKLAISLIGTQPMEERVLRRSQRKKPKVEIRPRLTTGGHWPMLSKKVQKCVQCAPPKQKGPRSKYICEACEVHLCVDKCFKRYHTRP
jgi:DNA excision repair protein ERCC-6